MENIVFLLKKLASAAKTTVPANNHCYRQRRSDCLFRQSADIGGE